MKITFRVRYKRGEMPVPYMPITLFKEDLLRRKVKYKLLKKSCSEYFIFYELYFPKQGIYNIRQLRKAVNYAIRHYRYQPSYISKKILKQWEYDDRNNIR